MATTTYQRSLLSVSLMTSVFCGFFATVVGLLFNVIFRFATNFPISDLINVSTLIYMLNVWFLIAGLIFYGLKVATPSGNIIFAVFSLVLCGFVFFLISGSKMSDVPKLATHYKGLLNGLVLIVLLFMLSMPVLAGNKKFEDFFL